MRFAYEKLAPWLTKIFPLAMPQILVANVIVATVAKVQIFPELCKKNGNYFSKKMQVINL
jgi:hypothetical protein